MALAQPKSQEVRIALPHDFQSALDSWHHELEKLIPAPLVMTQQFDGQIPFEENPTSAVTALQKGLRDLGQELNTDIKAHLTPLGNRTLHAEILVEDEAFSLENTLRISRHLRAVTQPFRVDLNIEVDSSAPFYGEQA